MKRNCTVAIILSIGLALAGCHSAGLVRSARIASSSLDGAKLVVEPRIGGISARIVTRHPPAEVRYSARRDGSTIRIYEHIGSYREKCIGKPVEVTLDIGPLPAGTYKVVVGDDAAPQLTADVTVPDGKPDKVLAGTTVFPSRGCG